MSGLRADVRGVGLVGPGLASFAAARPVLRGDVPHAWTAAAPPAPSRLPPAERRRAGPSIRLAMAVADEAVATADIDPSRLATVFSSSGGEGSNCHALCETLASSAPLLSPTRFTNSVHNAPAGYWHIAVASQAASTSLSAYDGSFGAGLIEAMTQIEANGAPVLLVASDVPYPEPLHRLRPLPAACGIALLLAPAAGAPRLGCLSIELVEAHVNGPPTTCTDPGLEALRRQVPAAAGLPLLQALARGIACEVVRDYLPALQLRIDLRPGGPMP